MMWDISIDRIEQTRIPLLKVAGRLDCRTHGLLQGMLEGLLLEGHRAVEVDLAQVTHLDGAGAAALYRAASTLSSLGGRLDFFSKDNNRDCASDVA